MRQSPPRRTPGFGRRAGGYLIFGATPAGVQKQRSGEEVPAAYYARREESNLVHFWLGAAP